MSQSHFAPEVLGPSFDTTGGEVQQPGTLRRGEPEGHMQLIHEGHKPAGRVNSQASDKFAIRAFIVPDIQAHQLLPVDRSRKVARITVVNNTATPALGIFIGSEADVMNFAGLQTAAPQFPPNLYFVPSIAYAINVAPPPVEFTSKGALWYCASENVGLGSYSVQMLVEHFEGGTPVT